MGQKNWNNNCKNWSKFGERSRFLHIQIQLNSPRMFFFGDKLKRNWFECTVIKMVKAIKVHFCNSLQRSYKKKNISIWIYNELSDCRFIIKTYRIKRRNYNWYPRNSKLYKQLLWPSLCNKLSSLEQVVEFSKSYNLLKLNQEEIENLNRLITDMEIESVIHNLPQNKNRGTKSFTSDFTNQLKTNQ